MNLATAARRLIAVALAPVAVLGIVTATAADAQAATAVSACFRYADSRPYASLPVQLMQSINGRWTPTSRTGRTNGSGCATFYSVPSNTPVIIKASNTVGNGIIGVATYEGWPLTYATAGAGGANLGTGTVRLVLCAWGTSGYCAGQAV